MARPRKVTLEYFNMCVQVNPEMMALLDRFGNDAWGVMLGIWQESHGCEEGAVEISNELLRASFAKRCRVEVARLDEIVTAASQLGNAGEELVDPRLLEIGKLSSDGIRKSIDRCNAARRRKREGFVRQNSTETKNKGGDISPKGENNTESVSLSLLDPSTEVRTGNEDRPARARQEPIPLADRRAAKAPGWRPGTEEIREGVWLKAEEVEKLHVLPGGRDEGEYLIAQLFSAAQSKPKKFREYKNHYETALSWRDMKLSDGKEWNARARTYQRPVSRWASNRSAAEMALEEVQTIMGTKDAEVEVL